MQTSAPETSPPNFLRLPLEIRELIYEHLLVVRHRDCTICPLVIGGHSGIHRPRLSPAILRANRLINLESARVLYGKNTFGITIGGSERLESFAKCGSDQCSIRNHACWVHPHNLSLIRNLHINIFSYYNFGQDLVAFHNLTMVCRMLASLPPLRTLVVRYSMLLGTVEAVTKPDDAQMVIKCLHQHGQREVSDIIKLAFPARKDGAYDKVLLPLALLRTTRSVIVEPLVDIFNFCTSVEWFLLEPEDVPPPLSDGYAQFFQDTILLPPSSGYCGAKGLGEDDPCAYDSGVEL